MDMINFHYWFVEALSEHMRNCFAYYKRSGQSRVRRHADKIYIANRIIGFFVAKDSIKDFDDLLWV